MNCEEYAGSKLNGQIEAPIYSKSVSVSQREREREREKGSGQWGS